MLSLCMIVKNEEDIIEKCLEAVKNFVDEIIIVDTGSLDSTKKVCLKYTEKIYDFTWIDDFAAARNFSISKTSNDWILVLDADEEVTHFNIKEIIKFINNEKNNELVGRIKRTNFMDDIKGIKIYMERANRLFNKNYFCYNGTIHEQVVSKNGNNYCTDLVDICVEHEGYLKNNMIRKGKLNRNIDLLNKAIENDPQDPYLFYQLGKSYYMIKDFEKACSCFKNSLSYKLDYKLEYVEDLVETYGYSLIEDERYDTALQIKDYFDYYKNSPDFLFLMGIIHMNNAMFSQAIDYFDKCTNYEIGKVKGITTFLPYYNIGVINEVLGYTKNAIKYYKLCGNYENAISRLKIIE
ncbi:glycosyltransferase [Candidatus Clostridium stratigraminis]|uniref:Glycosyltransferase n=1 Tax=Candidatus Clostridium stratigraminis TaxID=3381661 RepID=A0ABW8T515_9CLOT